MKADPQKRSSVSRHKSDSQIIFGMVQRGGKAKVRHVKSSGVRVLLPEIERSVDNQAIVYSDEHRSYLSLSKQGYDHNSVKHGARQYVAGTVHTQNVENLWSNMKRGIRGVYRHVDAKYVQAYADEYAFRYSHRNDFQPMFWAIAGRVQKVSKN